MSEKEIDIVKVCKLLKIDRRCKPFIWNGELVRNVKYTHSCSGCNEHGEYENTPAIGCGCRECGYTGKRVGCYPELLASRQTLQSLLTH